MIVYPIVRRNIYIELGRIEMAKALNTKKETKKKPQKSLLEKRNIKKQKKNNAEVK
jgi:hypothetical protein